MGLCFSARPRKRRYVNFGQGLVDSPAGLCYGPAMTELEIWKAIALVHCICMWGFFWMWRLTQRDLDGWIRLVKELGKKPDQTQASETPAQKEDK